MRRLHRGSTIGSFAVSPRSPRRASPARWPGCYTVSVDFDRLTDGPIYCFSVSVWNNVTCDGEMSLVFLASCPNGHDSVRQFMCIQFTRNYLRQFRMAGNPCQVKSE